MTRRDALITRILDQLFREEKGEEKEAWDKFWREKIESGKFLELENWSQRLLYDRRLKNVILPMLGRPQGKEILEVGCGSGCASLHLATLGAKVALLDFSEEALSYSDNLRRKMNVPAESVRFVLGDIRSLPFSGCKFDLVYSSGVVEHYQDREILGIFGEFQRVLKIGGNMMAVIPNLLSAEMLLRMKNKPKGSERYISRRHLSDIAERAGFKNVKTGSAHAFALPVSVMSKKSYEAVSFLEKRLRLLDYLICVRGTKI